MADWDEASIRRIIKSVLYTERQTMFKVGKDVGPPRLLPGFIMVRGKAVAAVTPDDDTFMIEQVHPLGQNTPKPDDPLRVVNVPGITANEGDTIYAAYKYAVTAEGTGDEGTGTGDGNWEALEFVGGSGSPQSVVMVTGEVPPIEEISGTAFTFTPGSLSEGGTVLERVDGAYNYIPVVKTPAGTGTGTGTEDDTPAEYEKVTILNFTRTTLRASATQPIILVGTIEDKGEEEGTGTGSGTGTETSERVFIFGDKDIRSWPGFLTGQSLILWTPAGSNAGQLDAQLCGTGTGS